MKTTASITIGIVLALFIGYIASYLLIREVRPTYHFDNGETYFSIKIRHTVCAYENGTFSGRMDYMTKHEKPANRSTEGFYLSYIFQPAWKIEAALAME